MDTKKAIDLLKEQIARIDSLKEPPSFNPKYKIWDNTTSKILEESFSAEYLEMYNDAGPHEIALSDSHSFRLFLQMLEEKKQLLEGFINERNRLMGSEIAAVSGAKPGETYQIHPAITKISIALFNDGHFAQCVEEAFKRVINEVKARMLQKGLDIYDGGDSLMNHAFGSSSHKPAIKFNDLSSVEHEDEQKGIMFLFKAIVAIRNRKAHDNVVLDSPERAYEYLCLASLLMRLLELSKEYEQ